MGAFILRPVAQGSFAYDSNIFEEADDETDSFITTLSPRFSVESDFSRHRVRLQSGLDAQFFLDSPDDDAVSGFVSTDGTLDITRRLRFRSGVSYRRVAEQRGTDEIDDEVGLEGPVFSNVFAGEARLQYLPGDFRIEPFASFSYRDFEDRDGVEQDDRDRLKYEAGVELGYRALTGFEVFVRGSYFDVDFDESVDSDADGVDGVNRDNNGFEVFGGVKLGLSRLLTGSVGGGVIFNEFDDPALDDTQDFTVRAALDWSPRRRININLAASRTVEQTAVEGASDKTVTDARLTGRYEILRNLNGSLQVGFAESDFNDLGRTDTAIFGQAALNWSVTRRASLRLAYRYLDETSDDDDQEFDKHVVTLGVRYGF
ncbi:MAG: outer membrane beta-barrel protein [Pseudomonadota bacterium]